MAGMKWVEIVAVVTSEAENLALTEIGAVLFLLGFVALFASKISFSAVPLFLLSGLLLGNGGLAPLHVSGDFLKIGAQIGAILLLLLIGLEYSARELGSALRDRKSIGLIDFVANGIPGALFGLILGWGWTGALILGGITYVSSSGIAAELIRDSGLRRSEVAKRAVVVLAIEDLALAPYLPLASAVLSGASALVGIISVSAAFIVIGVVLVISVRRESLVSGLLRHHDSLGLLLTVFGSALLAAGAATYVGFSGVVAAFLVGLLLTGEVANAARLRLSPLRDLFAAIFFLFFGLSTDPREITAVLPIAIALTLIGALGKFATGWWSTRDMSDPMSWRRTGALLIPRGEFSVVIAGLASAASFGERLQAITITYVILTTTLGSILMRFFRSRFARSGRTNAPRH